MPVLGLKAVNQPGVSVSLAAVARLTNLAILTDLPAPQTVCSLCHQMDTDYRPGLLDRGKIIVFVS